MQYSLSSDDCELLLAFEQAQSVAKLAEVRHRDVSVVSRQISRLGARKDVLEKKNGQWHLTPLGHQVCQWSRRSIQEQQQILDSVMTLRIATTPEFSSRVLVPGLRELIAQVSAQAGKGTGSRAQIEVLSATDEGVERRLLAGEADLAFDCGRPENPAIKFKLLSREPLVVVAAPEFLKKHSLRTAEELIAAPHIRYTRLPAALRLKLPEDLRETVASFDTIASARAACVAGLGWALLPWYTLQAELETKRLKLALHSAKIEEEQFGVWWLRDNRSIEPWAQGAVAWLGRQQLGPN
jgi:DNA-binding transcriptional LysR family regulator